MSDIAIRVAGLGKLYRIGKREPYRALRDTLTDAMYAPFRKISSAFRSSVPQQYANGDDSLWALKDVSFEISRGEVVGVIGRNGAGKSTLLKILSRITEPTEGQAELRGRVGSLLEVGTGFHPELTGRENIYLNGAILGMKKVEISRRFHEIVAFAEIDKFLDTPVKHYSSGMYMRLAFAVAAHLEPEILVVDEVLTVGDLAFQKKCLGKMGEVARGGRTILLVSHQMNQIRRLCNNCIWLENGRVRQVGPGCQVIASYEDSFSQRAQDERSIEVLILKTRFVSWLVESAGPEETTILRDDEDVTFCFRLRVATHIARGHHGIALFDSDNLLIWAYSLNDLDLEPGDHELRYSFPVLPVKPGVYYWQLSLYDDGTLVDLWHTFPALHVDTPLKTHHSDSWQGVLNPSFSMAIRSASLSTEVVC
jgi:lipopolysaccharide transport system ATP-binding protein